MCTALAPCWVLIWLTLDINPATTEGFYMLRVHSGFTSQAACLSAAAERPFATYRTCAADQSLVSFRCLRD